MSLVAFCFLALIAPSASGGEPGFEKISFGADDWPWWRGPDRTGIASPDQKPPTEWSETKNVLWRVSVPGRGHGSPIVVGDHVYLATADEEAQTQSVLCFRRASGELEWSTVVHRGGVVSKRMNTKASFASSTPACDGERVYINFFNNGAVYTTALDRSGKQIWQTKITEYEVHQGYGSSPAIYGPLVIVSADNKGGGRIQGLERATGKVVWSIDRPKMPNYTSPIILKAQGRDQLVFTGCEKVTSLDPLTGKKLWETPGATTECVTSAVTDGTRVFTSGGYPKNHVSAVMADGSGMLVWETKTRVYVPSLLVRDGYLYGVQDAGIAMCWESETGKEIWSERLGGGFSSSPVLVGDHLYATNESGQTYVCAVTPKSFAKHAVNKLGDQVMATPTICGGRIYMRVASNVGGKRKETLYCIGDPVSK